MLVSAGDQSIVYMYGCADADVYTWELCMWLALALIPNSAIRMIPSFAAVGLVYYVCKKRGGSANARTKEGGTATHSTAIQMASGTGSTA